MKGEDEGVGKDKRNEKNVEFGEERKDKETSRRNLKFQSNAAKNRYGRLTIWEVEY